MGLSDELAGIAEAAAGHAGPGEEVTGVLAAEPSAGSRLYLCAFRDGDERVTWLALDGTGGPVVSRSLVRDAASIVSLCELAEEAAGGGSLDELRSQLVTLRLTEAPDGIERAEEAALALERVIGTAPRISTPAWLDAVGAAARELEVALGEPAGSPFAEAMRAGLETVELFVADVERGYRVLLD